MSRFYIQTTQDIADAEAYWKDKEVKVFAVEIRSRATNDRRIQHTMYVRAKTKEGAENCAEDNDFTRIAKPVYRARLAGPRELECVPAPTQSA